jgi:hypothetical protein
VAADSAAAARLALFRDEDAPPGDARREPRNDADADAGAGAAFGDGVRRGIE